MAYIAFELDGGVAHSLPRSLFGSIWKTEKISDLELHRFLGYVKSELSNLGVRQIQVTCPSHIYSHFVNTEFWLAHDFQLLSREFNQHIPVTSAFDLGLHQMEKRKLRKLHSGKICFRPEVGSTDILTESHEFIAGCREEQGLKVNIDQEKLLNLCFAFPENYEVFTARAQEELVSVVITCQLSADCLYYYLPATDSRYRKLSPMVGLVELIHQECYRRGVKYLDMGISSINGELQTGLHEFKKRLGAHESTKSTVFYDL